MKLVEQQLWFHHEVGTVETIETGAGLVVGFSERSPEGKCVNEDAVGTFIFDDQVVVLAIADGMGGANGGDRAAQTVISAIAEHIQLAQDKEELRTKVLDAIESANQNILSWGIGAGATLVVGLIVRDTLRVFHVGDAEALLCSNRGRIKFSTVAHSPIAMAVELGVMNEQEAMHHEDRNIVNNHVGSREMRIEIGPTIRVGFRDTVLLASDGLFDNLLIGEIVDLVRLRNLPDRANLILQKTRERMSAMDGSLPTKPDDLSVLMFRQVGI